MGRARKPKDTTEELLNMLFGVMLILSYYVWGKTQSWKVAIISFFVGCAVIYGIKVVIYQLRNNKLLYSGINIVDTMSGEKFEEFLLLHFQAQGYKGYQTPSTEDYGADLVLEKDGRKIVIQAKRWKQTVGIEAVQQVNGAIKYYNADKGMVITNSYFSENAYELAKSNGIELWDRTKLIELMSKSGGSKIAQQVKNEMRQTVNQISTTSEEICPRCGKSLVTRNGKRGMFLGCSGFPSCRFTKDLS